MTTSWGFEGSAQLWYFGRYQPGDEAFGLTGPEAGEVRWGPKS